ncbi:sigma-70 family RNA polymerase sigma factor [Nocardioides sp.]|uniref:RNA polymerase sigma factor n=1 Tax=Nocardioides sp. TaxID=35761 RepID=UPI0026048C99|nr:sigma-70 family RNA polymerase sigma factor [Nocardioides sp.]
MSESDDAHLEELARRARSGDREALEEMLTRIRPMVVGRCRQFLPYSDDAEEAAQDALLAIATRLERFSGTGSFRAWAVAVTSNSARDTYRSLVRRSARQSPSDLPEHPDPRTTSVIAGTRIDLLDALERLEDSSPSVVESFLLRDLGGLDYQQIVELTGVPLGTVKDRIHRARAFLRTALTHAEGR